MTVCAKHPGRSVVTLSRESRLAGLPWRFLPFLPHACAPGAEMAIRAVRVVLERTSGQQVLAAHAAWTTLTRRAQLLHLVLLDLSHQHVEGILHALARRG